jgi:gamma-glutamyl-gamma-aminobutyrate hydrolase PuuD
MPRAYGEPITHSFPGGYTKARILRDAPLARGLYERDRFELDFMNEATTAKNLYYLGICRSHQLLNVARGGKLIQDIQKEGFSSHSHSQESFGQPRKEKMGFVERPEAPKQEIPKHPLSLRGELAKRLGADEVLTNAAHHQAVGRLGRGVEEVATSHDQIKISEDQVKDVQFAEATRDWNLTTLQYHPEARLEHATDWAAFSVMDRAWAFDSLSKLSVGGKRPTAQELIEYLAKNGRPASQLDQEWIKTDLAKARGLSVE